MRERYRHTKIIVTLGPATEDPDSLRWLIREGVDVMRLNMAHGSEEWIGRIVPLIRELGADVGRQVAIMMDVKGPEIRTAPLDEPLLLRRGERIDLVAGEVDGDPDESIPRVGVNYPDLARDLAVGATVLVDNGLIQLRVVERSDAHARCEVVIPGRLGSRRHINLPGVKVNLPSLTAKDRTDVAQGVRLGIDFFALSFVREADDVEALRALLRDIGSQARIIAKIEEQSALRNLDSIVERADAVMVARGDLGIEIDYHQLPIVQQQIGQACLAAGKPFIIATHLLESMIDSPLPTRAEISDVANAVKELADAVMLSGETTTGQYPRESVEVLRNILLSAEQAGLNRTAMNTRIQLRTPKAKMLLSAAVLARELGGAGIVVFTRSGFLPFVLAALRQRGVPIYAFTDVEAVFRQMLILWGVEPFLLEFSDDPETTIERAFEDLLRKQWCVAGDHLVVITNALAHERIVDTIQLRQVEEGGGS